MAELVTHVLCDPRPNLFGTVYRFHLNDELYWLTTNIQTTESLLQANLQFEPALRVVFTLKGKTQLEYNKHQVLLTSGEGALLPYYPQSYLGKKTFYAGFLQKEVVICISPSWLRTHGIDDELIANLLKQDKYYSFRISSPQKMLVSQLLHLQKGESPWRLPQQIQLCNMLLLDVLKNLFTPTMTSRARLEDTDRVERAFELLHSQVSENISLQWLAKACYTNTTTLQKEFRQKYGCTVFQYQKLLKLGKAKQALLSGSTVSEAAHCAGYKSVEYFSKQFYKEFGVLPSRLPIY